MSDEWDSYFANVNDELASLFVDLGIRDSLPDPLRPHLTWCWVYMNQPRADGLSDGDEAPLLGAIEDDFLGSLKETAFAGRITTAGRREFISIALTGGAARTRYRTRCGNTPHTGLIWGANATKRGLSILICSTRLPRNSNG